VIDIVVKAFDDIEIEGDSAMVTVTKGAPCASAATCLDGQKCDAGKCYWDPPAGETGDACTYKRSSARTTSAPTSTAKKSVARPASSARPMPARWGSPAPMPAAWDSVYRRTTVAVAASRTAGAVWTQLGLTGLVLGLVLRRRKR